MGIRKQVLLALGQLLAPDPLVSSAMPVLSALRKVCSRAERLVKLSAFSWSMALEAASIVSPLDMRSMDMLAWLHNISRSE